MSLLLEIFNWDDTLELRFEAYRILRRSRGDTAPLFDDFKAGVRRS